MTLFALLVGINNYPPPLPALRGCVNDVQGVAGYLQKAVSGDLRPLILLDEEAKRDRVIAAFRDHLGQAGAGDTALFYFAGHGSQQKIPPSLAYLEADLQIETLVLWDSRAPKGWDLADKEIAVLIHDLAKRGAHIVVILDCCHSGTATRGENDQRQIASDVRIRPLESLITSLTTIRGALTSAWDVEPGRHVLLAACRDFQLASEGVDNGERHGLFTASLLNVLRTSSRLPTYRDLMAATSYRISARTTKQLPALEATHPDDLDRVFLGSLRAETHRYYIAHHEQEWLLEGGAIHGLRTEETLGLYAFDAPLLAAEALPVPLTTAAITAVQPHQAVLAVSSPLSSDKLYKAVPVTGLFYQKLAQTVFCAPPDLLEIALYQYAADNPKAAEQIASSDGTRSPFAAQLSYREQAGAWYFPRFELRITCRAKDTLYIALLLLGEDSSIRNLIPGGLARLEHGQTQTVRAGARVEDAAWQSGRHDGHERLKLIAHTAPFNTAVFEQSGTLRRGGHDLTSVQVMLDVNITILRPDEARVVR